MTEWHVPAEVLARFVIDKRAVDHVTAASIEQHLVECASCQAGVAEQTPEPELERIWSAVVDRVDQAEAGFAERLLCRFGCDAGPLRLIAATPALRLGVLVAVAAIVAAVVWASRAVDASGVFLVLAPIVPTALVALSFAPGADPAGECGLATPLYGFGLVIRRALAVEALSMVVLAVGSAFVPIDGARAVAWLLPAAAASIGTLAASVRWPAPHAAIGLLAVWFAGVAASHATALRAADGPVQLVDGAAFGAFGQLAAALCAVAAAVVVVVHRHALFQEATQ